LIYPETVGQAWENIGENWDPPRYGFYEAIHGVSPGPKTVFIMERIRNYFGRCVTLWEEEVSAEEAQRILLDACSGDFKNKEFANNTISAKSPTTGKRTAARRVR
jgi:hypothetical protein